MRSRLPLLFLLLLVPTLAFAQQTSSLTGRWVVSADFYGTTLFFRLDLEQQGDTLTGELGGDKLEGTVSGNSFHFLAKDESGGSEDVKATFQGDTMTGTAVFVNGDDLSHPVTHLFTATLVPARRAGPPQHHEFVPTAFYRQFSPLNKPVLTLWPGDSVHTTTVDAGGTDEKGVTRVLGGNPETGPFYIETASPGDTLVVHFTRIRLNRDYAISDDGIVGRAVDNDLAVKVKDLFKDVRWHLDRERGVATSGKPGDHLKQFIVPLRPMLGCVATAPGIAQAPPPTGDSGRWGGNMDFNEIVEGSTVYLPVNVPGALLYVGDGHAAQGDGELNGNALETSMDVEFTVEVLAGKRVPGPRVESATHIIAMGLGGSLDEAFRGATSNMAAWLAEKYGLTPSEVAQVLGTSAEYKVSEVADRNAGMVLMLRKDRLQALAPAPK
ncbi:MAG TPA: acetamidase/formamidase family protein [Candidatus Angelobacter sp.]|nr:acetamidase/formamidase family protein [Candidatus Angelobacter sp.]